MARKQLAKAKRRVPKTVLRLPDLDQAKSAVLNSLSSTTLNEATGTRSRSSSNGTARSLGSRSARLLSFDIAYTWNLGIWRPASSTFAWARCAASPTKRPTAVC